MKQYTFAAVAGLAFAIFPGVAKAQGNDPNHAKHNSVRHSKTSVSHKSAHHGKSKHPKKLKSVPAHSSQFSKNVNHETNRESKDFNHTVGKPTDTASKKTNRASNGFSKNVNHETNRESKDFNHTTNNVSKSINHAFQGKHKKKDSAP